MKKRLYVFLLLFFVFFISGCGSAHETFMKAVDKTGNIQKGKSSITMQLNMEGVPELEDGQLFSLEKMTVNHEYDRGEEISKSVVYASINHVGLDFTIYEDRDNAIVTSPLLPKLLVLNKESIESLGEASFGPQMSLESDMEQELAGIWHRLLTDESVSRLGSVIVTTPDGDVKGKEFEIRLTSEQLKPAIIDTMNLYIQANLEQLSSDKAIEKNMEQFLKRIETSEIGPVSYYAYIDRDQYIIEEKLSAVLTFIDGLTISIDFQLQRYDLEKDVLISIPVMTKENVITADELFREGSFDFFTR